MELVRATAPAREDVLDEAPIAYIGSDSLYSGNRGLLED
jgi:hypothetical protein